MIVIKSQKEIQIMREAAKVTAHILDMMQDVIQPGITTAEIDRIAERVLSRIHIRLEDEALKDLRDLLNEIV